MPNQVRIISARNSAQWDDLLADTPLRTEHTYGGITTGERADQVRRRIRTAAKHKGLGAKVFWYECPAKPCPFGADCAYHVSYTLYDMADARAYKARQASPGNGS